MTLKELAQVLRERQIYRKLLPIEVILAISDEKMIESYMKCSKCGTYAYTVKEFTLAAERSSDYDSFFDELEKITGPRHNFSCN